MALYGSRWRQRYGPWAVVTGASDGIGRAAAQVLAANGLNVVLASRRRGLLDVFAEQLEAKAQVQVDVVAGDLSSPDGVKRLLRRTEDLDVGLLVAAAGFGTSGPFLAAELSEELAMLDLNCKAVLHLSHAFGRRLADRGRGGIVLFSSIVAFQGVPKAAHYAASKAYIQTLAEGLHFEMAADGVDVIASAPGPVNSGFATRADMRLGAALAPEVVAEKTLRALGRRAVVRPGLLSKALEAALTLPRTLRIRVMQQVMAGMTKHQAVENTR